MSNDDDGPGSPWPKEREERLLEVAPTARWVGEIALALGVSKNSVIGKMARMRRKGHVIETDFDGRTGRPPGIAIGHTSRRPPPPRPVAHAMTTPPKPRCGLPPPEQPEPCPELAVYSPRLRTLLELGAQHCRWPIGDGPPYLFCGAVAEPGRPYCHGHLRLARGGHGR